MLEIGGMKLYDVPDLANLLGLNPRTVRALLRTGKLSGRKLAKKWYVSEDVLQGYFKADDESGVEQTL
jgi:hypothetical protein